MVKICFLTLIILKQAVFFARFFCGRTFKQGADKKKRDEERKDGVTERN